MYTRYRNILECFFLGREQRWNGEGGKELEYTGCLAEKVCDKGVVKVKMSRHPDVGIGPISS